MLDLTSRIESRLTFDRADDTDPVWSPDGRPTAFASLRQGHVDIYRKVIGASKNELVYSDNDRKVPEWWLKDGTILYMTSTGKDYHLIAAEGERTPRQIFHADFSTDEPSVSPDGRWSHSTRWSPADGRFASQHSPALRTNTRCRTTAVARARWRADGKELYYLSLDSAGGVAGATAGKMMAVDVRTGSGLETGVPRQLFEKSVRANPFHDRYGVTADGQTFLVVDVMKEASTPITVILDWPTLLPPAR